MVKKKQSTALVEVLEPTTGEAFAEARQAFDHMPAAPPAGPIRSVVLFEAVNNDLRQLTTVRKHIEAKRKSVTTHLDAAKKAVNALFKPMVDKLDEMRVVDEGRLENYDQWQAEEQEKEREVLRKKAEAADHRAAKKAEADMYAARTRGMRKEIKQRAEAKQEARAAVLDSRLADVDDTPDAAEGIARIEDVEIEVLDLSRVPEFMALNDEVGAIDLILWTREPLTGNIKKILKAGGEIPGVACKSVTRRSVRSL